MPSSNPAPLSDLLGELVTYVAFGAILGATLPLVTASHLRCRVTRDVPRRPGRWIRRAGRATALASPLWDFSIVGAPPADIERRPYVVVANHVSLADPFVLCSLPWDMQWVGKESLFKVPVMGWIMRLGGDISLRRGSGESVRAMFDQCRRALDGGLSVMLFPEGTRATASGVQPFKNGAFELAVERQVPVLPIAIAGTEQAMRKGSGRLGRAKAVACILPPIETKGLATADVPRVRDEARESIAKGVVDLATQLE